jgi:hypothetical protein
VSTSTISNANLQVATTVGTGGLVIGTIGNLTTGKYYWEATIVSQTNNPSNTSTVGIIYKTSGRSSDYLDTPDGDKFVNPSSAATNDILGVAVDFDSGSMSVYKNNTLSSTVSFTSSLGWYPAFSDQHGDQTTTLAINFGQRPFSYTPPTGFVRLNTFNLPDSTIKKGSTVMDATLYTGNGSTQTITNASGFKPDLVWIKSRSAATDNKLTDSVRGATIALVSNTTAAETTDLTGMTAFNANGFTLGASTTYNNTGATYVGWQWQAGQGTNTSNTSGSITSTVSVNATAGFSVVTYTGTGANATVGHGLGVAPKFIAVKCRNDGTIGWVNYHASLGNTKFLNFNNTNAAGTGSTVWNNTSPTSTTIALGTDGAVNGSTKTYVAYCWAEIEGFSKFGSYVGNGSADGTFIYTGFLPKFILIKCTDTAGTAWVLYDTARDTYNQMTNILLPNSSSAELSGFSLDVLSNGFKHRQGGGDPNATGRNYIYACFASNPFKNSNAR